SSCRGPSIWPPCCWNSVDGLAAELERGLEAPHQYPSRIYGEPVMPATFSIIGLVLNIIGVLVLFRYGMPYRVRTGGDIGRIIQQKDEGAKVLDVEYDNLGRLGLIAVLIGTAFQIIGAIVPP